MSSNDQLPITYPPDISCFAEGFWDPDAFRRNNCSVSTNMVNYLNLTADVKQYVTVYCLNPPADDICPFGFCPNPDIAGPLVRIANYVTGFCLAILIFYSSKRVKAAFWSQALITYSLLITCGVSLLRGELTRYHSIILISLVCSPVNVYFAGYSIRAFWSTHRLEPVLGKKQYGRRAMVFLSVAVWVAILVYAYLPQSHTKFAQDTCRGSSAAEAVFLLAPIVIVIAAASQGPTGIFLAFLFLLVPILIVVSWTIAIVRKRKEIWPPGEPYRPKFGKVWRTVTTNYPFLQFWSVVAIPTVYWIGVVEVGTAGSQDVAFSLTFGQVLAVFMAVPPLIEVTHSAPQLWRWFINLPWIRFITGRRAPKIPGAEEMGTVETEYIDWQKKEKKGTADSQTSFVAEEPRLGIVQQTDDSNGASEYGQFSGSRP
ncbi:hypothetical protein BJ322DRAFT_1112078 [Thelephora terrestris]|uniref:Uncharacterized protein n=1 Tax=Thelephora terrestris TaxID=56493 RepID=A0A9P6H886_9AGAM|nr:hypothetical protein BJ322DRAFT_1112078 [Thelephora terrestris]